MSLHLRAELKFTRLDKWRKILDLSSLLYRAVARSTPFNYSLLSLLKASGKEVSLNQGFSQQPTGLRSSFLKCYRAGREMKRKSEGLTILWGLRDKRHKVCVPPCRAGTGGAGRKKNTSVTKCQFLFSSLLWKWVSYWHYKKPN